MKLLLASCGDVASMNIMRRLQEATGWKEVSQFRGKPVLKSGEMLLTRSETPHLFADDVDRDFVAETGLRIEEIIFLSKHKAASGIRTLTVHPIGNYSKADYGGRPGELVLSSPRTMTGLLRGLARSSAGLPFKVSFEVTHHGPWLDTPSVFIEIGSGENDWGHEGAADAIAKSILNFEAAEGPVVVGVGGGHYAPRFSELCLAKDVAFGHMVPSHAIDGSGDDEASAMMISAARASGTDLVYVHKKSMSGPRARQLKELAASSGLRCIDSSELKERAEQAYLTSSISSSS